MADWQNASSIYDFTLQDLKGNEVSLAKYKGYVCIIVNVASKCGLTASNYKELVELHTQYGETKGLRILAFPCNQFMGQEPGNADDIECFLLKQNVAFDVFQKIDVNGNDTHPLYKYLKSKLKSSCGERIKWNFTKFIIDRNGQPVERHGPKKPPLQLVPHLEKYW